MKFFCLLTALIECAAASSEEKGFPLQEELRAPSLTLASDAANLAPTARDGGLTGLRRMTTATSPTHLDGTTIISEGASHTFGIDNVALATAGSVAFASGSAVCTDVDAGKATDAAQAAATGIHCYKNVNDGLFGNSHSWIDGGSAPHFVGIAFTSPRTIEGFAIGRDQTIVGLGDRWFGTKTFEVTGPGLGVGNLEATHQTTSWTQVGATFTMTSFGRHVYSFSQSITDVTGVRLTSSDGDDCIDELEVYGTYYQPESPADTGSCFHASGAATLESGASRKMSELSLGDVVQVADEEGKISFSQILLLPHKKNDELATFLNLTTESGKTTLMTGDHLIPRCGKTEILSMASELSVGDCLLTADGKETLTDITSVVANGIYTAVTKAKFIVVNGIVASPFSRDSDRDHSMREYEELRIVLENKLKLELDKTERKLQSIAAKRLDTGK